MELLIREIFVIRNNQELFSLLAGSGDRIKSAKPGIASLIRLRLLVGLQPRFDLETAEDVLAPQIKKIAAWTAFARCAR